MVSKRSHSGARARPIGLVLIPAKRCASLRRLLFVHVLLGDVILGDLSRSDFTRVGLGRVLDAADHSGFEGLSLFDELLDALRIGKLCSRESLGVSGLAASFRTESPRLRRRRNLEIFRSSDAPPRRGRPLPASRLLAVLRLRAARDRTVSRGPLAARRSLLACRFRSFHAGVSQAAAIFFVSAALPLRSRVIAAGMVVSAPTATRVRPT